MSLTRGTSKLHVPGTALPTPPRREVLYVPGPVEPKRPNAWQQVKTRYANTSSGVDLSQPLDEVAQAKLALLELSDRPMIPPHPAVSYLRARPWHSAAAAVVILGAVAYLPMTRAAVKLGMLFALRSAVTRLMGRVF